MDEADAPPTGPPTEALEAAFHVDRVRRDGDRVLYFGESLVPHDHLIEEVWPAFREAGYEVRLTTADRVDVDPGPPSPAGRAPPDPESFGGSDGEGDPGSDPTRASGPGTTPTDGRNEETHRDGPDPDRRTGEDPGGWDRGPQGPGPGEDPRRTTGGSGDGGWVAGSAGRSWSGSPPPRSPHVLVAEPRSLGVDGVPWTNVVLLGLTVLSTLWAGAAWYHIDLAANPAAIVEAWPFTLAIMGVLGVHELGHYVTSRYHGVDASLPYFIPVPTLIGTMGAVIRMKGRMPDREALFDIGVSGPIAGLVATVVVTAVGLHLDPVSVPEAVRNSPGAIEVHLGFPPLMYAISWVTGQPLSYPEGLAVNPVVIGGWVGMFVTFLNLIPVGQLDGGHVLRALLGDRQETVAAVVPAALFGLAGYLYYFREVPGNAVFIWAFWGLFAAFFAFVGPASPVDDEPLDRRRVAVGLLTLVLGALCFTPVPIAIVR